MNLVYKLVYSNYCNRETQAKCEVIKYVIVKSQTNLESFIKFSLKRLHTGLNCYKRSIPKLFSNICLSRVRPYSLCYLRDNFICGMFSINYRCH